MGVGSRLILPGTVGALLDADPRFSEYLKTRTIDQNPQTDQKVVDVITFVESKEYLGLKLKPKQAEILWKFNHEKEEIVLPDLTIEFRPMWKEFVGKVGMRSGKTVMASCQEAFELYNLLMLEDPQAYYGLVPGQEIYLVNVAASESQSKDTIFAHLRARIDNSQWFQRYISHLKSFGRVHRGDFLYRELENKLEFNDKHIICLSMNSNSLTNVGKTAKFVAFDELAKFKTSEGKDSADEVYSSISRATQTFGWNGHVWSISSSLSDTDKMEELYETARKGEISGMLGYHLATWEFNPSITRADLDREYKKDEVLAKRDFECIPPKSSQEFVQDPEAMKSLIFRGRRPVFTATQVIRQKRGFNNEMQNYVQLEFDGPLPFERGNMYVGHGDPALTDDSYCLGVGHLEYRTRIDSNKNKIVFPNATMDALLEWKPVPEQNAIVDMLDVAEKIKIIFDHFNLSYLSFDRWNSAHIIQELLEYGINAEDLKFTDQGQFVHYQTLKRVIASGQFESFAGDEGTFEQFKVLKVINGIRIDHPKKGKITDKDRADCWASICHKLMADLIEEGTGMNEMAKSRSKLCTSTGLVNVGSRVGNNPKTFTNGGVGFNGSSGLGAFVRG